MDDDDFRRGKPSSHKVFGEGVATLAGDGLFAFAFEVFTRSRSERKIEVIQDIAGITGPKGVVAGQEMDIRSGKERSPALLRKTHFHKTALFITGSIRAGAIIANVPEPILDHLTRGGKCLGMLFQITDDLLDLDEKGTEEERLTYPSIYGVESTRFRAKGYATRANHYFEKAGKDFKVLNHFTRFVLHRKR